MNEQDSYVFYGNQPQAMIKEILKVSRLETRGFFGKVKQLTRNVVADQAGSVCYGNLIHALNRLKEQGKLQYLQEKIYIGQGYKDKKFKGIGIGICTKGASKNIKGCPLRDRTIVEELTGFTVRN